MGLLRPAEAKSRRVCAKQGTLCSFSQPRGFGPKNPSWMFRLFRFLSGECSVCAGGLGDGGSGVAQNLKLTPPLDSSAALQSLVLLAAAVHRRAV